MSSTNAWVNWLVIYPDIAMCVLMAVAMLGLMVFGLTYRSDSSDDDSSDYDY